MVIKLKKYIHILKAELMTSLQYLPNTAFGVFTFFIFVYIMFMVWQYIYSNPQELINGYSITQMTWYLLVTEILFTSLGGRRFCKEICKDVKSGNITYNLNKPYSYVFYALFKHLGSMVLKFIVDIIIGVALGFILIQSMPEQTVLSVILVLVTCFLAELISIFLIIAIGLLSFFIEDANPFYWLYSKMILIFGTFFPIEFFPEYIRGILRYSPIYVISYGPARLFVNFDINEFINILIAQIIYIFISYGICSFLYAKGSKRLNVNGG